MATCHRRGLSPLNLTFRLLLPCIFAIAALSFLPFLRFISSSNSLQTLYRAHLQVLQRRTEDPDAHFPCPGAASLRGRRPYQEDRILCSPAIHLPHSAARSAGLFGVFDGHLGDAASDFAASSITERFLHHASLRIMSSSNISFMGLDWLEAALIAAISDIDAAFGKRAATNNLKSGSTACLALQVDNNIVVANVGDSRAFICSSCERQYYRSQTFKDFRGPLHNQRAVRPYQRYRHHISTKFEDTALHRHSEGFCVKSLTSDHRPDRPDEKRRIEAFGGFVTEGSVPRVNGQLAVSRSIGDIDFRKYGVISEPEVSGWHQVSEDNKFLIIASDGIFEKLSPEEVCNLLHALQSGKDLAWVMKRLETNGDSVIALPGTDFRQDSSAHLLKDSSTQDTQELGSGGWPLISSNFVNKEDGFGLISMPFLSGASSYTQILAHILVELAFRAGSTDNLSLVIVPLKP